MFIYPAEFVAAKPQDKIIAKVKIADFNRDILDLCQPLDNIKYKVKASEISELILSDKYKENVGEYLFKVMQDNEFDCQSKERCINKLARVWNKNQMFKQTFCGSISPRKNNKPTLVGMYYVGRYVQLNERGQLWSSNLCENKERLFSPVYKTPIDYTLPAINQGKVFTVCNKSLIINMSAKRMLELGITTQKNLSDTNRRACAKEIIDGKTKYYVLISTSSDKRNDGGLSKESSITLFKPIRSLEDNICSVFPDKKCPVC
ncbi:hypothetical protein GUI12_00170 [Anaplasmataceae bacterium AB001_6]|nr:hypothetical protein GUI12_00170 [Anaplasmataceae bacterium AB001_6]